MTTVLSAADNVTPMTLLHPLASLQPEEVTRARDIITQHNGGKTILWKIIAVKEPNKEAVVKYVTRLNINSNW
jgi:Cu2+-containing amine oxidase